MTCSLMSSTSFSAGEKNLSKRMHAFTEMVQELSPDFIGVQSLTRSMYPYLQELFQEYGIFGDSRHSLIQDEYCSILFRKDTFELVGGDTKWLSHTPDKKGSKLIHAVVPAVVTFGYFKDTATEDFFTVANTHLDPGLASVRNEQAEILARTLMERQKGSVLFVTGNFNATHDTDALHLFQKAHLNDVVNDKQGPTRRGMIPAHLHAPTDHIYVSKGLSVLNVRKIHQRYHGVYPSSHDPIIAYIAL